MTDLRMESRRSVKIEEIEARSIISPSKLPDADYVVNPYVGCSFGCSYCYAAFMGRMVGHSRSEWGSYVYVKQNAVTLFREEIRAAKFREGPSLLLSSVTDAWQGPERKYRLARGILSELVSLDYTGRVSVLTKSPLILRDLELLQRLRDVEVGVTITTESDQLGAMFEAHAPRNSDRLSTLRRLCEAGLNAYVFLGPLMAHHLSRIDELEQLIFQFRKAGVSFVYVELLNLNREIIARLKANQGSNAPAFNWNVTHELDASRRAELTEHVSHLVRKHGLVLRLGKVLDHSAGSRKSSRQHPCSAESLKGRGGEGR